jgi:uncharacterized protein GlcG (DUF336 family)
MSLLRRGAIKLTLEGACVALEGAMAKADEIGVPMDIAVVDDGGVLLAFCRMDGAKLTSVDISISKAFTAASTRKGTHEYAIMANAGGPAFGIHVSNGGRFMIVGGGLPILVEGQCVGGIGCSSGSPDQDQEVAQAGIDALLAAL